MNELFTVTLVGAGSTVWGPTMAIDILLQRNLPLKTLILYDINPERLVLVERLVTKAVKQLGLKVEVKATTNAKEAVTNARFILTSIHVGGDDSWTKDVRIPHQFGIYQSVGDTIGPGGLMRGLRNIPVLVHLAKLLEKVGHKDATIIQLSNPMNPICAALTKATKVPVIGICHGVMDTEQILSNTTGIPIQDIKVVAAGNNHFLFADHFKLGDKIYDGNWDKVPSVFYDAYPLMKDMLDRFGVFTINNPRHPAEFLPWYNTKENNWGADWGFSIEPGEITRREKAEINERVPSNLLHMQSSGNIVEELKRKVNLNTPLQLTKSREKVADLMAALLTHGDCFIHVNISNYGAVPGVFDEANLELPAQVIAGKLYRIQTKLLPEKIRVEVDRIAREQIMVADAALTGNRELAIKSLDIDALVPNHEVALNVFNLLIESYREYVHPKFFN